MQRCNLCDAFVTPRFARVFGDNEDDVYGCYSCMTVSELADGEASRDGS
jgi:hypothetical protein